MPNSVKAFSWDDLWLRPDQQAEKLFQQGETKVASQLFENPEWKGTAAYRSGDYENAIEQFSQKNRPLANFNRGNSLAFAGRLEDALEAYQQVLAESPQHEDAQFNRDLIVKLLKEEQQNQQKKEKEGRWQNIKQREKDDSAAAKDGQNTQTEQESSAEKNDSSNQQSSELQKNNSVKQSIADVDDMIENTENTDSVKNEGEEKKVNKSAEQKFASNNNRDLTPEAQSKQQVLEQWLRKIPDDPGRLLRNKMQLEFKRRGKQRIQNEQYW